MRSISSAIGAAVVVAAGLMAGVRVAASETARYDADLASSRLTVEGTSTVHDWTVEGRVIRGELVVQDVEPASLWTNGTTSPRPLGATVFAEIPVDSLKSDNNGLNRRMYEALRATAHPMITYRLERAEILVGDDEDDAEGVLAIHTKGVLTIAGVDRTVDIPMEMRQLPDNRLEVSGETSLRMTEFGIDPPTAMMGFLRTGDTVWIRWTWVLTPRRIDSRDDH